MMKKTKRAESIIQTEKYCYLCRVVEDRDTYVELECHHCIHGIANRRLADRLGLWIWLCPEHHRTGKYSVHKCKEIDTKIEQIAQAHFEKKIGSREDFMRIFGKNYL